MNTDMNNAIMMNPSIASGKHRRSLKNRAHVFLSSPVRVLRRPRPGCDVFGVYSRSSFSSEFVFIRCRALVRVSDELLIEILSS
jgi:hypothetical protein